MLTRQARWLLTAFVVAAPCVLLGTERAVMAQEAPDPGRLKVAADDFDEGARLFKLKQYDQAAERFESADRLAPSPAALSNAIRARKSAKHEARAATLAAQALTRYPDNQAMTDLAESTIKGSEKSLHRVELACSPACTVVVDGKVAVNDAVAKLTMFVEPGAHALVAGWSENRSKSVKIEGTKGGKDAIELEAPPIPAAPKEPAQTPTEIPDRSAQTPPASTGNNASVELSSASSGLPPWVFVAGAGLTAVSGGLLLWSGLDTQKNPGPDAVHEACKGKSRDCGPFQDGLAKERRTNVLIATTAGVGVATAVIGAFFTDWSGKAASSSSETAKAKLVPQVGVGQGVSVGVIGVF